MSAKSITALFAGVAIAFAGVNAAAAAPMHDKTVQVGGAPMYPSKNIILVAAVKAAGLVDTLSGPGPFTVFAPTNEAFAKLPAGAVDTLVKPENKATLTSILTYHVVAGRLSAADLMARVKSGHGKAMLKTVQGEDLTVTLKAGHVVLTDAKGGLSRVTIANVAQSNGVIHVVDTVLMP
jgi:uncharacterized surface protein with fasciclin (FAS1) repeats